MPKTYLFKDNRLLWKQTALDRNGKVIVEREVSVPVEELREEVERFWQFVETVGGDLASSIRVEAQEGKKELDSLVDEIKRASSPYEVKTLGDQLTHNIELIKRLELFHPIGASSGAR